MVVDRYKYVGPSLSEWWRDDDGSWCLWEDVEKLIAERDELRELLDKTTAVLRCEFTRTQIKANFPWLEGLPDP